MSEAPKLSGLRPVVPFLKIPDGSEPYLVGSVCQCCEATFLGERPVCSKCGARDQMEVRRLPQQGTLYTYSIVYRSYPGVAVPYISAVVDLPGGFSLKGNLIDVAMEPSALAFDMLVEVVFGEALGRKDAEGNSYLSYFFRPAGHPVRNDP